jgi:hypothetical protein
MCGKAVGVGDVFCLVVCKRFVIGRYTVCEVVSKDRVTGQAECGRRVSVSWRWRTRSWQPVGLSRASPVVALRA